jgi:hypothetical protein
MTERRQFASGGRYTRTISAFLLQATSMKPGSWWRKAIVVLPPDV